MNERYPFRNLEVWKISISLAERIYKLTGNFPITENYGITSQLRRSSISISNNICEGRGRLTKGEYKHFLGIARGSSYEVSNLIELCLRLQFGKKEELEELYDLNDKISSMLFNLIKTLK